MIGTPTSTTAYPISYDKSPHKMATNTSQITMHPIDATQPSVTTVFIALSLFTSEQLDKNRSNWQEWSRDILDCLSMSKGFNGHLDGTSTCPDASYEPRALYTPPGIPHGFRAEYHEIIRINFTYFYLLLLMF